MQKSILTANLVALLGGGASLQRLNLYNILQELVNGNDIGSLDYREALAEHHLPHRLAVDYRNPRTKFLDAQLRPTNKQ